MINYVNILFKKISMLYLNNYLKLLVLIFLVSLQSCKSDDEICIKDITNSTKTIEELYNCSTTFETLSLISKEDPYIIITNKDEYDSKVEGDCHPEIDFTTYNLLIGYLGNSKKVVSLKNTLYRACELNTYTLEVDIESKDENAENLLFTYHLLVPKNEQIDELKVIFLQNN